jgi:hypothetical protein
LGFLLFSQNGYDTLSRLLTKYFIFVLITHPLQNSFILLAAGGKKHCTHLLFSFFGGIRLPSPQVLILIHFFPYLAIFRVTTWETETNDHGSD